VVSLLGLGRICHCFYTKLRYRLLLRGLACMSITHRGLDFRMAQKLLHRYDVGALREKPGRKSMAESMTCNSRKPRFLDRFFRPPRTSWERSPVNWQ